MGTSGGSRGAISDAFNLPTSRPDVIDRAGALPLIVAPAQVLDDARGVTDRLTADLQHRHHRLPGQLLDVRAVAAQPRDAPLVALDPAPGQLPRHLPARAETVRRRLAAVQHDGLHPLGR